MYLNSKKISVENSFIFRRDDLLTIANLIQKTMFSGSEDPEIHVNCALDNCHIGGSVSALHKLNPQSCINSFAISFQKGPNMRFTLKKSSPASNELAASISHPDLAMSISVMEDFCQHFPFKS